jgi:hypothetical protein
MLISTAAVLYSLFPEEKSAINPLNLWKWTPSEGVGLADFQRIVLHGQTRFEHLTTTTRNIEILKRLVVVVTAAEMWKAR